MRTARTVRFATFLLVAFPLAPSAQLAFDAATIKESKSLAGGGTLRFMPGGGITAEHLPARAYLTIAYDLKPFQLVGAPAWTRDTYYDVVAKPAAKCLRGRITFETPVTTMKSIGQPIQRIVQTVVGAMGAPVSDDTGLTGTFDIDLRWTTDVAPAGDVPSLVTALPDQLGLKLERRRVTENVLVVDHIEHPAQN